MAKFIYNKIGRMVIIILGSTLFVFLLMHAIPGNPWSNYSSSPRAFQGIPVSTLVQKELSKRFGLDLPLWRQYTRYIFGDIDENGSYFCGAICGNLGPSMNQHGRSVNNILFSAPEGKGFWQSRFGYSFRLVLFSGTIAACLGVILGIWIGIKPFSPVRRGVSVGLAAIVSIPNFIIGLLAIIIFASWLKWIKVLPDWNDPVNWLIPAFVLAIIPLANIARITSAAVSNVLAEDFVRTARAKGVPERTVIFVHVLRNAMVNIISYVGPTVVELFSGLLVVEGLYSFPGFGREYWLAVINLDYPVALALTLFYASAVMIVNLLVEIAQKIIDPRLLVVEQRKTD